jgi:hypothetical protein
MMQDPTTHPAGFAPGTMILTAGGERPVEALVAGTMIVTLSGRSAPLKPIRALRLGAGAAIRLRAGALGPMLPLRDLVIGAGQWLRCDSILLQAALLDQAGGIATEPAATLIAIELEAHDLVVAEGTPVATLPLPRPLGPPEPGLVAALRAALARRAAPGAASHPAAAELDKLIGMPKAPHG